MPVGPGMHERSSGDGLRTRNKAGEATAFIIGAMIQLTNEAGEAYLEVRLSEGI
jgi:hypothetical protein